MFSDMKTAALLAAGLLLSESFALPQSKSPTPTISISTATPENGYPNEAAFSLRQATSCTQTFTDQDRVLDFEYLGPLCSSQGPCPTWGQYPLVYDGRGSGWAYYGGSASPVLFGNLYSWYVLDCTAAEFAGKPEALACGSSTRAILSPGSSPYNPSLPPRFNTVDFPNVYLYFNLKSLSITPLVNRTDTKAAVTFKGFKKNGGTVTHVVNSIDNKKRSIVTFPSNFVDLIAFDISVTKIGGGKTKLYAFALDDLSIKEHVKDTLPSSCVSPIPTGTKGPCVPKPTETKKYTINFDEVAINTGDVLTQLPTSYKGLTWPQSAFIYTKDTINTIYNQIRMRPGETIPPSGKNFLHSIGNFEWSAATQDERFGVEELSLLCEFPPWQDPDYGNQNGRPCVITFVGRRDKYDGSGLPEKVKASIQIPNPGNDTSNRPFKKIKLNKLTNSPGGFRRLVRLNMFVELGEYLYGTGFALDNMVITKELGEGTKCRAPGVKTINFDELAKGSYVPTVYKDFKFFPNAFKVNRGLDFPAGSQGRLAAVSAPNAVKSQRDPYVSPEFTSIISPVQAGLINLESVTITLDIAPTNVTALNALNIYVSVYDACGNAGVTLIGQGDDRYHVMGSYYTFTTARGKAQLVFNYPYQAISRIAISASFVWGSGFENEDSPAFWIDDLKYRTYEGKIPGCSRCGFRGYGFCEVPVISR